MQAGERQVAPTRDGIRRDHVARYEWAAERLQHLVSPGARVLDVACGVGYGTQLLAQSGFRAHGCDRDSEALDYAIRHYAHAQASYGPIDAEDPAALGSWDAAVCFETIEHLADPLPLLKALRAAAPVLLASVPNETVFPHGGRIKFHHRHYTKEQFARLLADAGFGRVFFYGQAGAESEVEVGIEGRTLVAVAWRTGATVRAAEAAPALAAAATRVPESVAIVGLGPSCSVFFEIARRMGGASAYCDEVWGINAIGDVLRCDRVFHMDDVRIQELRAAANPAGNIAAMVRWLRRHPGPVYTSVVREGYPGLVAFPLEEVLNAGHDSNGGAPYFNSTAAYAIAYAVHIGVKKIALFGIDFTLANAHHAEKGRACCEFWLGIAAARGIAIQMPEQTSLMDACEPAEMRLYGYDCVDVTLHDRDDGGVQVRLKERERIPTAAEIEARYDHSKHPSPLVAR